MSIEDLKPEGFTEHMATYANLVKPWRMYVQGFALRDVGVWLRVAGSETMLGFGDPDSALAEAEGRLEAMLVDVRRQIADRKTPNGRCNAGPAA